MMPASDNARGRGRMRRLALLLVIGFAATGPPRLPQITIHVDRHQIRVTPEAAIPPTVATLMRGESSCPSAGGEVIIRNCLTKLISTPSSTDSIIANCSRQAGQLGCTAAADDELVSVRAIYDITISGQPRNECVIARVVLGNQKQRYVDMASLLFRPGLTRLGSCYTTPSVRMRIARPAPGGDLAARSARRLQMAAR